MTREQALKQVKETVERARREFNNGIYDNYIHLVPYTVIDDIMDDLDCEVVSDFDTDIDNIDWEVKHNLYQYTKEYYFKEYGLENKQVYVYSSIDEFIETKKSNKDSKGNRIYTNEEIENIIQSIEQGSQWYLKLENGLILELGY